MKLYWSCNGLLLRLASLFKLLKKYLFLKSWIKCLQFLLKFIFKLLQKSPLKLQPNLSPKLLQKDPTPFRYCRSPNQRFYLKSVWILLPHRLHVISEAPTLNSYSIPYHSNVVKFLQKYQKVLPMLLWKPPLSESFACRTQCLRPVFVSMTTSHALMKHKTTVLARIRTVDTSSDSAHRSPAPVCSAHTGAGKAI